MNIKNEKDYLGYGQIILLCGDIRWATRTIHRVYTEYTQSIRRVYTEYTRNLHI